MRIDISKYENIIFDFGGVILNIDYSITRDSFEKIGFKNFDSFYSQASQKDLFDRLETGKITEKQFYKRIKSIWNISISDTLIEQAWNALLLDLPISRIEILERLSTTHHLFLLSNTNIIHTKHFKKILNEGFGWDNFDAIFEGLYLSHEIGLRKPHLKIFKFVVDKNKLSKGKTLFIDDSQQHIDGAKKFGLDTYFLDSHSGETIHDLF